MTKIRTWDGAVPAPGTLLRDIGLAEPDFQLFTSSMQIDAENPEIIRMIGSSTERDMQGDTMTVNALADMTNAPVGLTIFLNHDYTLPGSLFGSLVEQPKLVQQGGVADIHIACDYEKSNPAAAQTYGYIKNGRRLGCSVGCMVLEYEIDEENDDGHSWWPPIIITSVLTLEWSVVGIPANQRCWVEQGLKGLFTRTFDKRLAAAVKGLYPRQYNDIIAGCPDAALRRDLARVVARPTSASRMEWVPLSKTFVMNTKGRIHEVGRDLVGTAVATQQVLLNNLKAAGGAGSDASWRRRAAAPELEQQQVEPDAAKGACGKTTWPLADRDRAWDNGEAHKRIVEWAGGNDDFSVAKLKQVHFWAAEGAAKLGDFKLLFCDVIDGEIRAVPHAIEACTGSHGVDAADIPEDDKEAIKKKIETYYNRMADEFNDPDIKVPWKEEEAEDGDEEKAAAPATTGSVASLRSNESAGAHSAGAALSTTKGESHVGKLATLDETQRLILKQLNQAGAALGLPPVEMKDDGTFVFAAGAPVDADAYAESVIERVIGRMFELQKAGAEFSKENMAHLCSIHKALHKMTDGKICDMDEALSGKDDDEDGDGHADPDGDGDNDDSDQKGMKAFIEATIKSTVALYLAPIAQGLGEVNTTLSGLGTKGLEQSVGAAQAQLVGLMRKIAGVEGQIAQTARNAAALYDMPVGRPTGLTRSTHEAQGGLPGSTVSREQLLNLAAPSSKQDGTWDGTLEQARRQCHFQELDAGGYQVKYRVWPAGVGGSVAKGVRPALTPDEKSLMRPPWILAYKEGGEATVPLLSLAEIGEADAALAAAAAAAQSEQQ